MRIIVLSLSLPTCTWQESYAARSKDVRDTGGDTDEASDHRLETLGKGGDGLAGSAGGGGDSSNRAGGGLTVSTCSWWV